MIEPPRRPINDQAVRISFDFMNLHWIIGGIPLTDLPVTIGEFHRFSCLDSILKLRNSAKSRLRDPFPSKPF
jgi:hypothetical protein